MFIRQTQTRNKVSGETYTTFRLVQTERIGKKVRQTTLLNLGRNFPVKSVDWPTLCQRIEAQLTGQTEIFSKPISKELEKTAQRYAAQLIARAPTKKLTANQASEANAKPINDFQEIDVNSLQSLQQRSVGVEHVGLHAISQMGLIEKLKELGINGKMRAGIIASLIGRMAEPGSELSTYHWLKRESGLGELIDVDFEGMPLIRLYRASDTLMKHKDKIEKHLFGRIRDIFSLGETVTLFDLTNTYFEGEVEGNPKAKRARSKEKRSDCPLVTLGLVLDGSGFVKRSKTFEGNVTESKTLETMLTGLGASPGAMVIMDCGIATEDNIKWLQENKYRYIVVSRKQERAFDEENAISIKNGAGETIRLQKELSEDKKELFLHCHSPGREKKENAILEKFYTRYEAGLNKISDGLKKPKGEKRFSVLMERIGRLKEKSHGVSQHYEIELVSPDSNIVTEIKWKKTPVDGTMATHPGVYCLRSNETTWNEEKLWRTYITLTDLESVFRSLKSELGLRPIYHSLEDRADGHLFITVLAYQLVQYLRTKLKAKGIYLSWTSLRKILRVQRRTTTSFKQRDGRTLNVRNSGTPEPELKEIYDALGLDSNPGGVKKMLV